MSDIPDRLKDALSDRYEILQELGSGGMATVYLANDLKHARKVAIKVLRPELAAVIGGERFVAEIRTTASLQHPHILPLFDSGEADRFLYYVMPFVEGESLRDRLDRDKQLPVEEAIRIAKAIASALHYAHERDIVHRDIKPANILMHAGQPVVADFGIAIAISAAGGGRLTETGMSVGTPHYMSPEQASADRDVDARSDTYALACVLYEMLAGQPPHTGPTAQAVLMRILTENPRSITDVRKSVPGHVRDALSKGLEKLPADRFPTAKAFADALEDPAFSYQPVVVDATVQALPAVRNAPRKASGLTFALPILGVLFGLIAGITFFGGSPDDVATSRTIARFEVGIDEGVELQVPELIHISADGRMLGFVGDRGSDDGIFVRGLQDLSFRMITGTDDADFMAFSPDGSRIAYTTDDGGLYVIATAGGSSRELIPRSENVLPPVWNADGTLTFAIQDEAGPFFVAEIPEGGGAVSRFFELTGVPPFRVEKIPDADALLFSRFAVGDLVVYDIESDSSKTLVPGARGAYMLPNGDVGWVDEQGGLWASRFDRRTLSLEGQPVPILTGIVLGGGFRPSISVSDDGTLVYLNGPSGASGTTMKENLWIVDFASGDRTRVPIEERRYRNVKWSPDGQSIAFAALPPDRLVGPTKIFTYNVALRTATRALAIPSTIQAFPIWSPDGGRIAYLGADQAQGQPSAGFDGIDAGDLFSIDLGTGAITEMQATSTQDVPYAWSETDGILHTGGPNNGSSDIMVWDPDGDAAPGVYLDVDGDLGAHTVSPAGDWIAYRTSQGVAEDTHIAVRAFPNAGPPIRISAGPGDRPRWSRDGSAIYYWVGGAQVDSLMRATVRTSPTFEVERTELVLTGDFPNLSSWDLHPDGDRMIIAIPTMTDDAAPTEESTPTRPIAVLNWVVELREAMGGSGR